MGNVTTLADFIDPQAARPSATVRVTNADRNGFVEFQFSLGDPTIYLEMTLPPSAFREFCTTHRAVPLSEEQVRQVERSETHWRYGADSED